MSGKKHVTIEIVTSEYIQIEQDIYEKAEQVFAEHGLTFKQAIEEFFRHSVNHGVPFTAEDIAAYEAEIAQEQTDVPEGDAPGNSVNFEQLNDDKNAAQVLEHQDGEQN